MPDEKLDMGWVVLSRALLHSEIWLVKPFSKGQAWIDLILRANYKRGYITTKNGQIVEVDRGQCGHSVLALAEKWGWSRNKVTRFLAYLKERKMIQQNVIANHSIVTICNYGYYQDETTNDTINDTINEQQTIQQTDTNNKGNKNNKDNTLSRASDEKAAMASDYQTAEEIVALHPKQRIRLDDIEAVVAAADRECDKPGVDRAAVFGMMRAKTQAYAEAVSKWPGNRKRFITACRDFFDRGMYNDDPDTWTQGDDGKPVKQLASAQAVPVYAPNERGRR